MLTPALTSAIDSADLDRLRKVLKRVCDLSNTSQLLVEAQLLVTVQSADLNKTRGIANTPSEAQESSSTTTLVQRPQTAKHQVNRYVFCENCSQEFDPILNKDDICRYHDGDLEVDYESDFWADHDENCHGKIDAEEMRKEFPEGFFWDCCEVNGTDTKGCQVGKHVVDETYEPSSKKQKMY